METTLLECQKAYIDAMARGKTAEMTELAKQEDKASHAELNRLRAMPANQECFDCSASKPGWAVLPWGHWICIDCAQVHRNLGRHISQTKAVNTGTYLWYPHELRVMREVGNARAALAFARAPPKPSRDAPVHEKAAYARDKYELRLWGPLYKVGYADASQVAPAKLPALDATPTVAPSRSKASAETSDAPAKWLPVATPVAPVDLMSLEPATSAVITSPGQSMQENRTSGTWASGNWAAIATVGSAGQQPNAALHPTPCSDRAYFAPRDANDKGWDQKKAVVLAQFSNTMSNSVPVQLLAHSRFPAYSPASFFAGYGL